MSTPLDDLAAVEREMQHEATMLRNGPAGISPWDTLKWAARIEAAREGIEGQIKALQDANELNDAEWRKEVDRLRRMVPREYRGEP